MSSTALKDYLRITPIEQVNTAMVAYLASLDEVSKVSRSTAGSIVAELASQRQNLKLIASENYSSLSVQLAMGNLLTDKYAEGYAGHRFYAGCENVDAIEAEAAGTLKQVFGCEHAYVQPHSGADANLVAFWAILTARIETPMLKELNETNPSKLADADWERIRQQLGNQRLLGLDYYSGGHLTHGYRLNVSAKMFEAHSYTVDKATGLLDYDAIERQACEVKPLILLAGYSAYPRAINFRRLREVADKVGAVLMVDMAHFAGLVAGGVFEGDFNPVQHAQVVTSTTHKTLRGPRGGLVLCTEEFKDAVDKGCPLILGGPLPHMLAAKAVAFKELLTPEYKAYAHKVQANARALAAACMAEGLTVASGGTDNHLLLVDVTPFNLSGRQAESALRECGITLNRNALPFDPQGPWYTSGLRLGAPAVTTLGMGAAEMQEIAAIIKQVLTAITPLAGADGQLSKAKYALEPKLKTATQARVAALLNRFPVYPELDLDFMQRHFG